MKYRLLSFFLMMWCACAAMAQTDSVRVIIRTSNGYYVTLDDGTRSANVLRVWTYSGKHKVSISDNEGFSREWEIEVNGESGTEFNFPMEGKVRVNADQRATVWVDGELVGDAPQELQLVGRHRITVDAGYDYKMSKQDYVFIPLEERNIDVTLQKARPKLNGFLIANYMISAMAPGGILGLGRRFGGYVKGNASFGCNRRYEDSYGEIGDYYSYADKNGHVEEHWTYSEPTDGYWGGSGGLFYNPLKFLTFYVGGGYASYKGMECGYANYKGMEYSYYFSNGHFKDDSVEGPQIDAGVIFRWKALLLQAGYSRILSSSPLGHHFGDLNVGIGVNIHKNKKRQR